MSCFPSNNSNYLYNIATNAQHRNLNYQTCKEHKEAYISFFSSDDLEPCPCFLNFITQCTIPTTRSEQTTPATSPPRKAPTMTILLHSAAVMDCSSVMGQLDCQQTELKYSSVIHHTISSAAYLHPPFLAVCTPLPIRCKGSSPYIMRLTEVTWVR